ncbi:MAG: NAD(P)H-hydrate epimerase [Actinobacteria bacterium]|nr:NAD(P)H-hydrate epimerase [Actinomycetota bacterium]MBU1608843.1 NAD(P)H-hydrate epimerase [Actinomycetota bacterium]MBU2314566.1 NAD(P)H-hydrate epimerase [Actinomycetota bacterium]MBU2384239.1 NAD(P)H-hydrate epimerase [Actinomycetota bacterium]
MRAQPFPEHLTGWTAEQVRKAEAPLLAAGEPLMLRAAAALAEVVRDVLRDRGAPVEEGPGILVLAGSGDNGGDALFAAAELAQQGARVRVRATGSGVHEEAADAALAAGAQWVEIGGGFDDAVTSSAVILDGIIGIGGSSPALRGTARTAVARIRELLDLDGPDEDARADRPAIVAVDLPSGVHSDDGSVPDPTVLPADVTVTFGAVKAGLLREPAARYAGEVRLVELGLDRA